MLAVVSLLAAAQPAPTPDAPPPAAEDRGPVVDRIVARVDGQVVTLSGLLAETRLVLLDVRGPRAARQVELTTELLSAVLTSMVHRALIAAEIRRLQLRPPADEAVGRALERLTRRFEDPDALSAFAVEIGYADAGMPEVPRFGVPAPLVDRMRLEAAVERFVEARTRLNVVLTEREARACYEAHRARFARRSFEEARPEIDNRLRAQKAADVLEQLVAQLTARAEVRVFAPYRLVPLEADDDDDDELGFSCAEVAR